MHLIGCVTDATSEMKMLCRYIICLANTVRTCGANVIPKINSTLTACSRRIGKFLNLESMKKNKEKRKKEIKEEDKEIEIKKKKKNEEKRVD